MGNTSKLKTPKRRDAAYYRQRQKNHVLALLVDFFSDEAQKNGITKRDWAEAMERDPSQVTRWLTVPCNLELDTISDMLLPLGAEMEHRIVRFTDRPKPNLSHPLMSTLSTDSHLQQKSPTTTTESSTIVGAKAQSKIKIEAKVVVAGV
jgi:hypothetical protein